MMYSILNEPVTLLICTLPLILALVVMSRKRRENRESRVPPFADLPRHPAGEPLRKEIVKLDDQIDEHALWFVLFPILASVVITLLQPQNPFSPVICLVISAGTAAIFGIKLYNQVETRDDYRLGFDGERFVAEELSQLIQLGFEIYHDVPFDGFSIDHVMVGSRGVFIVETRTRRKPVHADGKTELKVEYDGNLLHWPQGSDRGATDKARRNAKNLSTWLSSAAGENVRVTPILTLPGWMVELKVKCDDLYVLNPKQILKFCESKPETLDQAQTKRICQQLDQKCGLLMS